MINNFKIFSVILISGMVFSAHALADIGGDVSVTKVEAIQPAAGGPQNIRTPLINPYPRKSPERGDMEQMAKEAEQKPVRRERKVPSAVPAYETWDATDGQSLETVLRNWSSLANVELIWDVGGQFETPQTMSLEGRYEDAVRLLLEQFEDREIRPLGSLHINQEGGKKILVVEASGSQQ